MFASFINKLTARARAGVSVSPFDREGANLSQLRLEMRKAFPHASDQVDSLIDGYEEFAKSGAASTNAYYAFRDLYWKTHGQSNVMIGNHVRSAFAPEPATDVTSIFGPATARDVVAIADTIKEQGFYRFPNLLPSDLVEQIRSYLDREVRAGHPGALHNSDLARTTFEESLLLQVPGVPELGADPLLRQIAAQYLGTSPVMGYVTSWMSRPHGSDREALSKAAQMFHVDMSNPNFLKAFVYLNEVTDANGPHCLVPGSHHRRDAALWRDGRIDDDEMARHYPQDEWAVLKGPPGSMFIVDTSAFHKGCAVVDGERHILQYYYVDTLFGESVPYNDGDVRPDLRRFGAVPPRFLSRLARAA